MILIIDNYDSFSYNLYQYIGEINPAVKVIKNDELSLREIEKLKPTHLIISPGPGRPAEAGICEEAIKYFTGKLPILGICLGHQAICECFGAKIVYAKSLMHGKASNIYLSPDVTIFKGLLLAISAARYHSLIAQKDTIPAELEIIAQDDDDQVMGVKHKNFEIYGLQFHPESVLTKNGKTIIKNFLEVGK
jgi:anthranilate synthase component 2